VESKISSNELLVSAAFLGAGAGGEGEPKIASKSSLSAGMVEACALLTALTLGVLSPKISSKSSGELACTTLAAFVVGLGGVSLPKMS
jgi:hypothetical protein